MKRVRPLVRWCGGKSRSLAHILPLIPKDTVCYCEPFAGGLAVLLAKPPSPKEVVNDLNGDLINLYNNVKFHLPEMEREMAWVLNSRQQLYQFLNQPGLTEIQRAARWLWRNKISFAGGGRTFGVAKTSGRGASVSTPRVIDQMKELSARIDRVTFEQLPYERCLDLYDSSGTTFFIDPPYLHSKAQTYAGWNEEQMTGLRKRLDTLKGRWIVTVDGSEFNRRLFSDFRVKRLTLRCGGANKLTDSDKTFDELVITPK